VRLKPRRPETVAGLGADAVKQEDEDEPPDDELAMRKLVVWFWRWICVTGAQERRSVIWSDGAAAKQPA
jgi:hypothetical protein